MAHNHRSPLYDPQPYIPRTLSEIWDMLGSMWLNAPTFVDRGGYFPDYNLDSRFAVLVESFGLVRKQVGDDQYSRLVDLAAQAKALFAADPEDSNGQSDAGRELLAEIEGIIEDARKRRVKEKLPDDEGEVTGD